MTYDVAFIGTGPDPDNPVSGESFAMAYRHASGYDRLDDCDLVACADLVEENALAFADNHGIDRDRVYEDYEAMLDEADPDIVSVCTPVPTHAPIVLDCLQSGVVDAIHCEKPMATTWGDARLLAQEADRRDIQLTFNHQRRMAPPWRDAKDLLDEGAVGDLERVEISTAELLDSGTHFIDLANMYNDDRRPERVIGQIDYREELVKYGAHNENQALAQWTYGNGVQALGVSGESSDLVDADVRLQGTDGVIEVNAGWKDDDPIRYRASDTDGWAAVEPTQTDAGAVELAVEHVVEFLAADDEPELSARHALSTTEVIFATYESSRKRGRVDLPLTVDDNPLEAMVERGDLNPAPAESGEGE